jgi:hypothetical protein
LEACSSEMTAVCERKLWMIGIPKLGVLSCIKRES